jgi:hypothetical protein
MTSWTPRPWKASPCQITLRKFATISCCHCYCCHCHHCRLQTFLHIVLNVQLTEQTGEHPLLYSTPLCTPRNINQCSPSTDWSPPTKLNNKEQTVIKHGQWRGWMEHWNRTREMGRSKELISVLNYQ